MMEQSAEDQSWQVSVFETLFSPRQWHDIAATLQLSPREDEIVRLLFRDLTENAMSRELGISTHTVHTHMERLFRKLAVQSRTGVLLRVFATYLDL